MATSPDRSKSAKRHNLYDKVKVMAYKLHYGGSTDPLSERFNPALPKGPDGKVKKNLKTSEISNYKNGNKKPKA